MSMRIELRDTSRNRLGRVIVDSEARPTRVTPETSDREVFLTWDSAVDDSGRLRRCLTCGCTDLFQEKSFPQLTAVVVVLAFAGAIAGILGFAANVPVMTAMVLVLALDVSILLFSRRRLVCYRCRSSYHDLPIARYHRSWDRQIADRYAPGGDEGGVDGTPSQRTAQQPSPTPEATRPTRAGQAPKAASLRPRHQGFTL